MRGGEAELGHGGEVVVTLCPRPGHHYGRCGEPWPQPYPHTRVPRTGPTLVWRGRGRHQGETQQGSPIRKFNIKILSKGKYFFLSILFRVQIWTMRVIAAIRILDELKKESVLYDIVILRNNTQGVIIRF